MSFKKLSPVAALAAVVVGTSMVGVSPAQAQTTVTPTGFQMTVTRPPQPTPSLPMRRGPRR